jgi:hypothetical protein
LVGISQIQNRITRFLKEPNISYEQPFLRTASLNNEDGGVVVTKRGEIDAGYLIVEKTADSEFVLASDYVSEDSYTVSQMSFDPNDLVRLKLSDHIARTTFFAEMRKTFLRYNGSMVINRCPVFPAKMENYMRQLQQEESYQTVEMRVQRNRMNGEFNIEGDIPFTKGLGLAGFVDAYQKKQVSDIISSVSMARAPRILFPNARHQRQNGTYPASAAASYCSSLNLGG